MEAETDSAESRGKMNQELEKVTERFLRYVKIDTQSDENAPENRYPSTEKQKDLAAVLTEELTQAGAENVFMDPEYGYVYASIPASREEKYQNGRVLGFLSHMDTSPAVSGKNVKPCILKNYDGSPIVLHGSDGVQRILSPQDFPELVQYIGKDLITTDGTTLLGADDKAGVAEIMTMAVYLLQHPEIRHGKIAIAFTPDEEVGAGTDHFDLKRFGAEYAYTVDGGPLGEMEYENFNAAQAIVEVTGRSVHPGDAFGKMKNAAEMAMEFGQCMPKDKKPEYTQGYEGFFHLTDLKGDVEKARMVYLIRNHSREEFEAMKEILHQNARKLNEKYGKESFRVSITDQYYNMEEKIRPCMFLIDQAREIMTDMGITPVIRPIRGGTDGARLSYMGLPCPNLCTGGMNYHSRYEYCCVQSMEKIAEFLVRLATEIRFQ